MWFSPLLFFFQGFQYFELSFNSSKGPHAQSNFYKSSIFLFFFSGLYRLNEHKIQNKVQNTLHNLAVKEWKERLKSNSTLFKLIWVHCWPLSPTHCRSMMQGLVDTMVVCKLTLQLLLINTNFIQTSCL